MNSQMASGGSQAMDSLHRWRSLVIWDPCQHLLKVLYDKRLLWSQCRPKHDQSFLPISSWFLIAVWKTRPLLEVCRTNIARKYWIPGHCSIVGLNPEWGSGWRSFDFGSYNKNLSLQQCINPMIQSREILIPVNHAQAYWLPYFQSFNKNLYVSDNQITTYFITCYFLQNDTYSNKILWFRAEKS